MDFENKIFYTDIEYDFKDGNECNETSSLPHINTDMDYEIKAIILMKILL